MGSNDFKKGKHKVEVFLLPPEFDILEDLAKEDGVSYSEYLRNLFLFDAVTRGNIKAIKLMAKRGGELIKRRWIAYGFSNYLDKSKDQDWHDLTGDK